MGTNLLEHYAVLGVNCFASEAEIRSAFLREARRWHPDKQPDPTQRQDCTAQFQRVHAAYEALRKPRAPMESEEPPDLSPQMPQEQPQPAPQPTPQPPQPHQAPFGMGIPGQPPQASFSTGMPPPQPQAYFSAGYSAPPSQPHFSAGMPAAPQQVPFATGMPPQAPFASTPPAVHPSRGGGRGWSPDFVGTESAATATAPPASNCDGTFFSATAKSAAATASSTSAFAGDVMPGGAGGGVPFTSLSGDRFGGAFGGAGATGTFTRGGTTTRGAFDSHGHAPPPSVGFRRDPVRDLEWWSIQELVEYLEDRGALPAVHEKLSLQMCVADTLTTQELMALLNLRGLNTTGCYARRDLLRNVGAWLSERHAGGGAASTLSAEDEFLQEHFFKIAEERFARQPNRPNRRGLTCPCGSTASVRCENQRCRTCCQKMPTLSRRTCLIHKADLPMGAEWADGPFMQQPPPPPAPQQQQQPQQSHQPQQQPQQYRQMQRGARARSRAAPGMGREQFCAEPPTPPPVGAVPPPMMGAVSSPVGAAPAVGTPQGASLPPPAFGCHRTVGPRSVNRRDRRRECRARAAEAAGVGAAGPSVCHARPGPPPPPPPEPPPEIEPPEAAEHRRLLVAAAAAARAAARAKDAQYAEVAQPSRTDRVPNVQDDEDPWSGIEDDIPGGPSAAVFSPSPAGVASAAAPACPPPGAAAALWRGGGLRTNASSGDGNGSAATAAAAVAAPPDSGSGRADSAAAGTAGAGASAPTAAVGRSAKVHVARWRGTSRHRNAYGAQERT
eukprot:CAMPEP_0179030660 /NCGR_PEP_ID=MMETSP0796-20121207/10677_1 /TAXON_ID=73915 /ORGANISM="Pyrodinium bahamense, Strain pbaha01" /LENGTH=782 /DNA_ID=CAMNT_0020726843 /DNA_START=135 /DNA_END=2479 /DNA_ORIENTATION=+